MNKLDVIIARLIYNKKAKIQPGSVPICIKKYQSHFIIITTQVQNQPS